MGSERALFEAQSQAAPREAGGEALRLRYEGSLSVPGKPPLEIWTILEGPASGASFSLQSRCGDVREVARQTALRFPPVAPPPPAPHTSHFGEAQRKRVSRENT